MSTPDITVIVSDGLAIHYGTDTQPVGTEAAGTSALVSRADHVHAHGNQTGPALHAIATSSANGFMSAADKAKIDTLTAGSAAVGNTAGEALDATTTATAGTASTAARSDHTHSIAVAIIGDVQDVGVAATGSAPRFALADHSHAHGAQSDPTDHALADGSGAGFMSAAEFTKLSGIAAGAIAATSTTPSPVGAAAVGVATTAARADHVHAHGNQTGGALHAVADDSTAGFMSATDKSKLDALPSNPASVGSVTPSPIGSAAVGTATTAARSDHVHAHGNQAGGTLHAAATDSVAGFMSAADKTRFDNIDVATTVTDIAASGVVGVLTTYALEDHVHAHGAQTDPTMHALADGSNAGFMSAAEFTKLASVAASATATPLAVSPPANVTAGSAATGTGTHAAKDDHVHSVSTAAAVGLSPASTSAAGSADTLARSDHTHAIATAVAVITVGTANAAGSAATFARGDHVHSHGAQTDGTLHAAVSTSVAGFMSAADKVKLNALVAGTDIQEVNTGSEPGTSTTWARSDHVHFHGHLPADGQMHAEVDGTDAGFAPPLGGVTGYVLTDNGDGTSSWLAPTGSGGTPADGSVTTAKIVDANVTSAKLADGSVTTVKLADANVTSAKIATGAVGSTQLASGSVIAAKVAAGAIGTTQLADANVTTAKLVDVNVTTAKLADGSVTTVKLADANVTTAKIVDANVTTAKIADANVTSAKIATGAVGATQIANGGVGTTQLAANAVTAAKIASATITSTQLAAAAVATANIADGAVTQAKLDSGVTLPLADNSVTTIKIVDANVTTGKLADAAITEAKLAASLSVPVPSYAIGSLPAPDGKTRLAKLTDKNKGLVYSNGVDWQNVGSAWPIYRIEDFGGVKDDSSPTVRTANNAAWTAMQMSMGAPSGSFTHNYRVQFDGGTYYFAGSIKFLHQLTVEGLADSILRPETILSFPPSGDGLQISYDNLDPTYFAAGSHLKNLQVTHDQTLASWAATTVYAPGAAIKPSALRGWTGYVFVNLGSSGTSGSTEPLWPSDLLVPTGLDGGTVSDGSVTWTAKCVSLLNLRATIYAENVDARLGYGNGFFVYGNTTNSLADGGIFNNCTAGQNRSAGILLQGQDSNENKFYNFNAVFNGTWGILDKGFLGNDWHGLDTSYNGPSSETQFYDSWHASVAIPVGSEIVPTTPNGYAYISSGTGSTGGSEPTWPTTIGLTVVDNAITWTCRRVYSGGPLLLGDPFGGSVFGMYAESSDIKSINNGTIIGFGNATAFAPGSTGKYWNQANHSPQGFQANSSDPSYDTVTQVGDAQSALYFEQYKVMHKNGSDYNELDILYSGGSDGYVEYTYDGGAGGRIMTLPLANTAGKAIPHFPKGISLSQPGSGNETTLIGGGAPGGTANQGDRIFARTGGDYTGLASEYVCVQDATNHWEETSWSAPVKGNRLDPLPEYGETDLHFLIDDVRRIYNTVFGAPETLNSRKGGYSATWHNGDQLNVMTPSLAVGSDTGVAYDSALRSRKIIFNQGSNQAWAAIAANAAHSLPASGAITLQAMWYSYDQTSATSTIFGFATATSGYDLTVATDGTLTFKALNTAGANFISLASASGTIASNTYYIASIVFDSVNNIYQLWVNGNLVASASSKTGTIGSTTADIAIGGLLTSGTLTNPAFHEWPSELIRTTRALTPSEIVSGAKQVRAMNSLATIVPAGVESLLVSKVVDLSLSTKQTLYTVPAGQHLIVTKINSRSPTATLTTGSGGVGYDAGASDVTAGDTVMPTTATTYGLFSSVTSTPIGAPTDVLGFKTSATQAATSMTIDVFGYFF